MKSWSFYVWEPCVVCANKPLFLSHNFDLYSTAMNPIYRELWHFVIIDETFRTKYEHINVVVSIRKRNLSCFMLNAHSGK